MARDAGGHRGEPCVRCGFEGGQARSAGGGEPRASRERVENEPCLLRPTRARAPPPAPLLRHAGRARRRA